MSQAEMPEEIPTIAVVGEYTNFQLPFSGNVHLSDMLTEEQFKPVVVPAEPGFLGPGHLSRVERWSMVVADSETDAYIINPFALSTGGLEMIIKARQSDERWATVTGFDTLRSIPIIGVVPSTHKNIFTGVFPEGSLFSYDEVSSSKKRFVKTLRDASVASKQPIE